MKELQKYMEIKPKFEEDIVRKRYVKLISMKNFEKFRRLQEFTGIKPQFEEDIIQEIYAGYLKDGCFNAIFNLQELTGIKPTEDSINEGLLHYLFK